MIAGEVIASSTLIAFVFVACFVALALRRDSLFLLAGPCSLKRMSPSEMIPTTSRWAPQTGMPEMPFATKILATSRTSPPGRSSARRGS